MAFFGDRFCGCWLGGVAHQGRVAIGALLLGTCVAGCVTTAERCSCVLVHVEPARPAGVVTWQERCCRILLWCTMQEGISACERVGSQP